MLISPELHAGLAAILCVLIDSAPPLPVIDQRNNHTHTDAISDLKYFVERSECFLVEFTRALHMTRHRVRAVFFADRNNVGTSNATSHLLDSCEGICDFKLVRKAPFVGGFECHVVFNQVKVWDVERDEDEDEDEDGG